MPAARRLVRLAFYHRIKETLPQGFWGLLGPEPMVADMPAAVRQAMFPAPPQRQQQQQQQQQRALKALPAPAQAKAGGDEEMAAAQPQEGGGKQQQQEGAAEGQQEAEGAGAADVEMAEQQQDAAAPEAVAAPEEGGGAAKMQQDAAADTAAAEDAPQPPSREDQLVAELVARIRSKQTAAELEQWLEQQCGPGAQAAEGASEEQLRVQAVRVVARGVLLAGCKSWEHSSRAMERCAAGGAAVGWGGCMWALQGV